MMLGQHHRHCLEVSVLLLLSLQVRGLRNNRRRRGKPRRRAAQSTGLSQRLQLPLELHKVLQRLDHWLRPGRSPHHWRRLLPVLLRSQWVLVRSRRLLVPELIGRWTPLNFALRRWWAPEPQQRSSEAAGTVPMSP